MKTITVTVVYPVTFQVEVNPDESILVRQASIKDAADAWFDRSSIDPIIHECEDMPELVE